jgi:hypothetical protein
MLEYSNPRFYGRDYVLYCKTPDGRIANAVKDMGRLAGFAARSDLGRAFSVDCACVALTLNVIHRVTSPHHRLECHKTTDSFTPHLQSITIRFRPYDIMASRTFTPMLRQSLRLSQKPAQAISRRFLNTETAPSLYAARAHVVGARTGYVQHPHNFRATNIESATLTAKTSKST